MVTKCQTGLSEFCDEAKWHFTTADDSKYSLGEAFGDLTVVGAVYNLGSNVAVMHRNQRMADWSRGTDPQQSMRAKRLISNTVDFFETKNAALHKSIIAKIAYLGAMTSALAGSYYCAKPLQAVGFAASAILSVYFMGKAGFDTFDRSMEEREKYLSCERRDLANQLRLR
jgi:hypothetical protein